MLKMNADGCLKAELKNSEAIKQEKDKIVNGISNKNKISLEERFARYEKLSNETRGKVEAYNCGEDLGKEKLY